MKTFKHLPTKPTLVLSLKKKPYIRSQHYNPFKKEEKEIKKKLDKNEIFKDNFLDKIRIKEIYSRVSQYYISNLILSSKQSILSKLNSNYFKYHANRCLDYFDNYVRDFINEIKKDLFTVTFATLTKEAFYIFDPEIFAYFDKEGEEYGGFEALKKMIEEKFISKDTYKLLTGLDEYFSNEFEYWDSIHSENGLNSFEISIMSLKWFINYIHKNKNKFDWMKILDDYFKLFSINEKTFWASNYAGKPYQKAVKILQNYIDGELSDTAFVESIFNLYHNTGMVITKYEEWNKYGLTDLLPEFFDKRQTTNDFIDLYFDGYLRGLKKFYKMYKKGYVKLNENPIFKDFMFFENFIKLAFYVDSSKKTKYHKIIDFLIKYLTGHNKDDLYKKSFLEKFIKMLYKYSPAGISMKKISINDNKDKDRDNQ